MTLYLKYRPQKVSELGLAAVRELLGKILAKEDVPHAFLFSGPRGTGKTSAARIVAKTVNCREKKGGEPCGECEMCRSISAGSAADVMEIDAASNRGIDEIRALREKVSLAPLAAEYKVYIIDEVHMLTTEAANALLKTLEEPPAKVVFVLCTTEPEKLPETVVSRCTTIRFKMPTVPEMVEKLAAVNKGEGAKFKAGDLEAMARAAKGSFRDAIKIMEQAIAADYDVAAVLGQVAGSEPEKFVELVTKGDTAGGLAFINTLVEEGVNVRGFIERCVEYLREQMLAEAKSGGADLGRTLKLIEGLNRAYERTKTAAVVQLPLEVFVLEAGTGQTTAGSRGQAEKETVKVEMKRDKQEEAPKAFVQTQGVKPEAVTADKAGNGNGKYRLDDVAGRWVEIMKQVKPKNHSVEALLRSTRPVGFDGSQLTLEVFYKFHMDKLSSDKCREIVETSVAEVFGFGSPVKLALRLGERKMIGSDTMKPGESNGKLKPAEELDGAVEEDIIRAAQEIFKAEVI